MSARHFLTLPDHNYNLLTEAGREKFQWLLNFMREIAKARKVQPACRLIAERLQRAGGIQGRISAERLRKIWNAYCEDGESALVDHNLCGGKCGLPDCPGRPEAMLAPETVEAWIKLAEGNDKNSLRWAHRTLIGKLSAGEPIAGVGTWRALYARLYPFRPLPAQCPWNNHRPPFGWSLPSFMDKKPASHEYLLAKKGLAAAGNALALALPMRTDLSGLRFMEVVVFDDHRLDCKAWIVRNINGRRCSQIVELWSVFALDLATRTVLAWGVRPRAVRDDGTKESITRRDMQHLIAGMLGTHGFPQDYLCTLLVENAAAAVTTQVETDLLRITRERVVVHRAGVGSGRSIGFAEKFGLPRDKRWIESFFNLLEIEIGSIKGQMGATYERKRGDFPARLALGEKLARLDLMEAIPAEARPFDSIEEVIAQVHDAILRMENRHDHALVNFAEVREWRVSADDAWKSCADPFFLNLPIEQQNALLAHESTGLLRKEKPAERRLRLHDPAAQARLGECDLAFLFMDVVTIEKYLGADGITFEHGGRTYDFAGSRHRAQVGQKLVVRFDADHPAQCILEDELGRRLGFMQQRRAPGFFEREFIAEQQGMRQKALGSALKNVRVRHADRLESQAMNAAATILAAELAPPAHTLPESAAARAALDDFQTASVPTGTSSEKYLERTRHRTRPRVTTPDSAPIPASLESDSATDPAESDFEQPAW